MLLLGLPGSLNRHVVKVVGGAVVHERGFVEGCTMEGRRLSEDEVRAALGAIRSYHERSAQTTKTPRLEERFAWASSDTLARIAALPGPSGRCHRERHRDFNHPRDLRR